MAEYNGWKEFYEIEPWGLMVQDAMQANVTGAIINMNRDTKKHPEAFPLTDFMMFERKGEQAAAAAGPVLLEDDDSQTELLISMMFAGMQVRRAASLPK